MSAFMCSGAFVHDETKALAHTTVLPSQFFGGPAALLQPEKRLMLAVLEHAAWLLLHAPARAGGARRQVAEAAEWVASDGTDWPFTFVNVCHALGLAPEWIRAGLDRASNMEADRAAPAATRHFPLRRLAASGQRVGARHRR